MYSLLFEKRALHDLNKLDWMIKERVWKKLQECKEDPFRFLEPLAEIQGFKLRVGDYRVIIDVDQRDNVMKILKVGHRKNQRRKIKCQKPMEKHMLQFQRQ